MSFLTRSLNLLKFRNVVKISAQCLSTKPITRSITNINITPIIPIKAIQSNNNLRKQIEEPNYDLTIDNSVIFPNGLIWMPPSEDEISKDSHRIEAPATENIIEKQAARLIVIRRKKMKKHKLRKLRKRMKFEWAKIRQRRELKKEKIFQAGLIAKCKEAEAFDAEKYVQERLEKLHEIIIPKMWKGRRMPEFLIRQKMGLPPKS